MIGVLLLRPETYYLIAWTVLLVTATATSKKRAMPRGAPAWEREFSWRWLATVSHDVRRFGSVGRRAVWAEKELNDACAAGYRALLDEGLRKIRV